MGEQRGDRLVILAAVRVGPEILVHERVHIVRTELCRESRADGQPAAVLHDDVQEQQPVVELRAAYAPLVEEQVGVLLRVIARGQVVYRDDHYLRAAAIFLERAAGVYYEVLGALAQRTRAVVDIEVLARLGNVRGKRAQRQGGQEQQD